jgi:hypothetical protein
MKPPVEEILRRMAEVRAKGHADVHHLDHAVERMKDWREHFKSHPWLATGLATVTAYLLVPHRRPQTVRVEYRQDPPLAAGFADRSSDRETANRGKQTKGGNNEEPTDTAKAAGLAITGVIGGMVMQLAKNAFRTWATNEIQRRLRPSHPSPQVARQTYTPVRQR